MAGKPYPSPRGMALLEVMLAVGIFAVVVGVTATSLTAFYSSMDAQQQRMEALQSCRSVLGAIREKRAEFITQADAVDRAGLLAWIEQGNTEHWSAYLTNPSQGGLRGQTLSVRCLNMAGAAPTAADSPLEVQVISTWTDMAGRPMQAQVATVLADR